MDSEVSPGAKLARALILLPILHLVGCSIDLAGDQYVLRSALCTTTDADILGWAALIIWAALVLALPIGLMSIRFKWLLPVYLILLGCIPIAVAAQGILLENDVLDCRI
jgi:hypothetical protein